MLDAASVPYTLDQATWTGVSKVKRWLHKPCRRRGLRGGEERCNPMGTTMHALCEEKRPRGYTNLT